MTKDEMKQYLQRWENVSREEDRLKEVELGKLDLPKVIKMFAGAFAHAMQQPRSPAFSGLIEQQALFKRFRNG